MVLLPVRSSQDLPSPVAATARVQSVAGIYNDLSSPEQTPPPPPSADVAVVNNGELLWNLGHTTPDRNTRARVRKSPVKQRDVLTRRDRRGSRRKNSFGVP
jgi:hypothetical protein